HRCRERQGSVEQRQDDHFFSAWRLVGWTGQRVRPRLRQHPVRVWFRDREVEQFLPQWQTTLASAGYFEATMMTLPAVAFLLALLRKEAAAWIAYRTKNGPCKTLEDLKKVQGLPFKKIDERRDHLVCF